MSWATKPSYPIDARPVTFRAVPSQIWRWEAMAKKHRKGSRGAFIAWAVDLACFFLEAQDRAHEERHQEMHLWDRK
jgi:hypothetical protein